MVYLDFRSLCLIIAMWRGGWAQAGTWFYTALDLRSLSLIDAIRRVGRGSGRHLVSYSLRFTFTEPHRRHAAWRHSPRARGEGPQVPQVGRGEEHRWGGGRGVKGDRDFKF
jgi:hypothetical protein